jgi:hypothetical protein
MTVRLGADDLDERRHPRRGAHRRSPTSSLGRVAGATACVLHIAAELIGAHSVGDVRTDLWPRVKKRAYATDGDDALLDAFLKIVGRRDVHLRPGLRVRKRFTHAEPIRAEIEAILSAAGEPPLPRPGDMSR